MRQVTASVCKLGAQASAIAHAGHKQPEAGLERASKAVQGARIIYNATTEDFTVRKG